MPSDRTDHARRLAERLHDGQADKTGAPYIEHLAAVVTNLLRRWPDAPPEAIEAAWLHDVLEDTSVTVTDLLAYGVSARAVEIILRVTRVYGWTYRQWIKQLASSGDVWAIRVKLADNEHNSDPSRRLPDSDIIERRYKPARVVLEKGLADAE